ncbi:thioredoxin family protein [Phycisphaera mikurensis]|uniref:Putative oxidoreductase n=1 Tax=Phycisphaera mikurensis (strain NBRC 102666 / KCTC 22515 / FYK2301M01) TaxID=1142394 RepID=I0IAS8_PHYMF|nr:thioredoxin family protein [Phycisphaera mikurensis]MBB6442658.1 thiol-disulfide isomerase/thioredoxin [Phycisphaera mikurensis]BAM02366.1 putative oxidoreductase [Phycisphaera mikurensis NBRC 102666]
MALTPSTMLPLGTPAPAFALPDTAGRVRTNEEFAGVPMLVMFICNHCPYVKHVAPELKRLGDDYAGRLAVVAISSNDAQAYPEDAPEKMKEEVQARGYAFPYLYDATQEVARAFTAACTPDFFLFDAEHKLAYRGELDPTRPHRVKSGVYDDRDGQADGATLRAAIEQVLAGEEVAVEQRPSMGCNIKWREETA